MNSTTLLSNKCTISKSVTQCFVYVVVEINKNIETTEISYESNFHINKNMKESDFTTEKTLLHTFSATAMCISDHTTYITFYTILQ